MRNTYNWPLLSAQFRLATVKSPKISMSAFASARDIPSSTFRKGIRRQRMKELLQEIKELSPTVSKVVLAVIHLQIAESFSNN
ncbi:hypothetical protein [Vibrio salinus]|uniref:hypothetical protein n=1 Tax=Vibrio salinus TaxID=2899784 RepID=UPI001E4C9BFE|nr:hypothetical protein [Vibrio salinus]MCE0493112.1 hypothetical protein [Vibrio salinus]